MIERTDNVKTALTQLAQQASSSGKAIKSLTWRMNSGAGFLPMALLKAEPGATVRVEMMEGGWSSGDGSAEWSFIEGQWRRGLDHSPHPGRSQRPDRHDPPGAHRGSGGAGMTQAIASGRPAYELRSRQRGPSDLELEVWQVPSTATPELKEPRRIAGLGGHKLLLVEGPC